MIKVKRLPTPKVLDGSQSKGGKERSAWEDFHSGTTSKKPSPSAYREDEVVLQLNEMFSHKCAYCESRVAGIDVEHWRPKNAIVRADGTRLKHGYWWLAADWNNLLLSCTSCNQQRKREISGQSGLVTAGKHAQFPISNKVIVNRPGDEKSEKPLLLDPTRNAPDNYLNCVTEPGAEDMGFFQSIEEKSWNNRQRAETSIKILGLNSHILVDRRLDKLSHIRRCIHRIRKHLQKINALSPGADLDSAMDDYESDREELISYLAHNTEDLMLARQVILPFVKRYQNRVSSNP